jgi:acetate kinase
MAGKEFIRILTINSGSSSLKFSVYRMGRLGHKKSSETLLRSGKLERIGLKGSLFHVKEASGQTRVEEDPDLPDHEAALRVLFEWLGKDPDGAEIDAVGHRIVHGGTRFRRPHLITAEVIDALNALVPLAPDHLPHEIKAVQAVGRIYPSLRQIACFDTAFHREMPPIAQRIPLQRELGDEGVLRYGFHGLSYEYIMSALKEEAGQEAADGRVIVAHLGNGASMAAVHHGKSVETTMGLTPAGGLVMSTRSGDLDPGVLLYLLLEKRTPPAALNEMVNRRGGLLGVSGISPDMKDLLTEAEKNQHAAEAVNLFCYQAKKYLGALAAVLGGIDTLVFTGGIGENAPAVRRRICDGLAFFGIALDPVRNEANAPVISKGGSTATVRVMKTNEELMIARETRRLVLNP